MSLTRRIEQAARRLREGRRRVWIGADRLWVEVRGDGRQIDALRAEVERSGHVVWARWNAPLARLVVAHRGDTAAVLDVIRAAEEAVGLGTARFAGDPKPHPGDGASERRAVVRAAASAASVAFGSVSRVFGGRPRAVDIDLAALAAAVEDVPQARRWIDRWLGGAQSDHALGLASALTAGLAQGTTGEAMDLVYRGLRWAEVRAARQVWRTREPELGGRPDDHPAVDPRVDQRPAPLPRGPIERYSEPAGMVSLGGFGYGVAATGRAEKAAASIFGGVPRPARLGREAFGAMLGARLAERRFVVLDDRPLRRLDRIDRIVLFDPLLAANTAVVHEVWPAPGAPAHEVWGRAHRLFEGSADEGRLAPRADLPDAVARWVGERGGRRALALTVEDHDLGWVGVQQVVAPDVRALVARIRATGLTLAVATDDPAPLAWCAPDRIVPRGDALRHEIRDMQRHGHGVLLVVHGDHPAASAADACVALPHDGAPTAWGAHLVGPTRRELADDARDVTLLVDAIDAAKRAARQSVAIAGADAVAGVVLATEGPRAPVLRRIMTVSGLCTLVAVANGARLARQLEPRPATRARSGVPWHALEPSEALTRLGSRPSGLSAGEASARLERPPPAPTRAEELVRAVWDELAGPFTPVLATGAALSALMGSPLDAGMVVGTVIASAVVGGWQQVAAHRALRELEAARPSAVRVRRDGEVAVRPATDVVPGDVILLEAGDRVPADCRILRAVALEADESSLTGESLPIGKRAAPSFSGAIAERASMLYADTTIAAGEAEAVAVAVGADTESRRGLIGLRSPAHSGVQDRLQQLTDLTLPVAGTAAASLLAIGLVRDRPLQELVNSAVSLTVAAVPETLPLLATAAQLAAARRLSARGALVRNIGAVEALGRVDVVCADKTGTLTEGTLQLRLVADADHAAGLPELDDALRGVLQIALLASPDGDSVPHPTDRALLEGARAAGVSTAGWERRVEIPFEPARGYHATAVRRGRARRLCVKGAPEHVVARCGGPIDADALLARAAELAASGLRILAVAERALGADHLGEGDVRDLAFAGFVGIADPVRPTARDAIDQLRRAGVGVLMITGDHPATAAAIARDLGLGDGVLAGPALDDLGDEDLDATLTGATVVARATPQLKVRIVASLQRQRRVVAMTGDGANDAPAIGLADVGIALGERATAAARGAADLWVNDGRFDTVVGAILEGRAMWASVRDAVSVLLGGNLGELAFTLAGGAVQGAAPLTARQLMLVNLLTDALPALTIAVRPPAHTTPERLLAEGPDRSLGAALNREIAWRAAATAGSTMFAWATARPFASPQRAGTIALLTLVGTQLGQTVWVGWRNPPVVAAAVASGLLLLGVVETPGISRLAGSTPLGPIGLAHAALAATGGVVVAGTLPELWRLADRHLALEAKGEALARSELGHYLAESRLVGRILGALDAEAAG